MAVIVYKCSICNRTIGIPQNKIGLETIGTCTITAACKGKLSQVDYKQDYVSAQYPSPVLDVSDWSQRKALYNHTQNAISSVWRIKHNLGVNPALQVFILKQTGISTTTTQCGVDTTNVISSLVEALPEEYSMSIINQNEIELNFSYAVGGTAQCLARETNPSNISFAAVSSGIGSFQISTHNELSIATLNTSAINTITIAYITPNNVSIPLIYTVDNTPSINSSWVDMSRLYINGKVYTVRSFSLIKPEMTNNIITNGTSFFISGISYPLSPPAISKGDAFVLLSNYPYATVDKIYDSVIDVSNVNINNANKSFYYNNGEFYAYSNLTQGVYPIIKPVV